MISGRRIFFLPSPSPLSFFRPRTYRKGYYFYSPQSCPVIKSKKGGYNNITNTNKVSPTQNTPVLQATYLLAEERRAIVSWIFICSYLYFAQTKVNTIGLKMTFRKSKLIHNRPDWPPLNLRGKCGNTMLLLQKPVLCRRSLNSLWERRPTKEENCFLLCVKCGYQGDQIGTENLQFQPSKQTGSFDYGLLQ